MQETMDMTGATDEHVVAPGAKALFVASTGGHLAQLRRIAANLDASPDSLWVTFDSPQSRSLLDGARVEYVPYIKPRDWRATLQTSRAMLRILRRERFDVAVSTGAAPAVGALPLARLHGIDSHYIESVSRTHGPSLTGRILHASRMVHMHTQYSRWAEGRWRRHPSVLSHFRPVVRTAGPQRGSVFVTLGTIRPYRFDALIDRLLESGAVGDDTIWQIGETDRDDLPGTVHRYMEADAFGRACRESDVVVTHSGVGTILQLLELGVYPVVVPRRAERDEHVDDHQELIAALVDDLEVARWVEAEASADIAAAIQHARGRAVEAK